MSAPAAVPPRYQGVWKRSLLETPELRDDTCFVRWMQTPHWHADLRVPPASRVTDGLAVQQLALQQGFCGTTSVDRLDGAETCAWLRQLDFQPPGPDPDIGRVVFETPDRLIETGIHREYREVWERVPGSTGRFAALEAIPLSADAPRSLVLVAGRFLMRVRARSAAWPPDTVSLPELVQRRPDMAPALLDFEISFGKLENGRLHIVHSTLPALEGRVEAYRLRREGKREAVASADGGDTRWKVLDWVGRDGGAGGTVID